ncbi:MAG: putative ABC exporter domain-containing protein [Armatimonadetes bacterium]|nr:putative ABC exporter domain-containing protein [Armatimonadota bacterium]
MRALFFLITRQWKGAITNTLRSGIRTLFGILGVAWIFGHITLGIITVSHGRELPFQPVLPLPVIQAVLLFMLALPAYAVLLEGFKGGLVTFTAADVDFLFSMPLPQRLVLAFRLVLQSAQLLGWITLGTLGISPYLAQLIGANVWDLIWRGIVATFLCFLFLLSIAHAVYILYAYRIRASERLNLAVKAFGILGISFLLFLVAQDAMTGETPWQQAVRVFNHPVVRALLFPVTLATDLIMSAHPLYEERTMSRLLLLLALGVGGVLAMLGQRENVYEPSLGVSLRKSRLRNAFRSGGISAARMEMIREGQWKGGSGGLALPDLGPGWRALVWKSLQIWLHAPWTGLFVITLVAVGIPLLLYRYLPAEGRMVVVVAPAMVWVYITWMAGVGVFQQIRNELSQGDFLKLLPLPAWQVVLGLVFIPIGAYTVTLWVSLAAFGILFREIPQPILGPLAVLGPLMMAALSLYHAMVAFLFPRKKDPMSQLLAGLLMMPGWGIFLFLPITLGVLVFTALVNVSFRQPFGLQQAWQDPETRSILYSALTVSTGTLALAYAVALGLLLWLAGSSFRAYSPAEE